MKPHLALIGTAAALTALVFLAPPIPQPLGYHDFADRRACLGLPNCLDTASNAFFVLAGAWGLHVLLGANVRPVFLDARERWPYALFFLAVVLIGLASAWYHLALDNARLAWDRAALAVSCLAILATAPVVGAYADLKAAKKRLLALSTAGCVLFTALLYFAQPDTLWLAVACLVLSNFFFGTGENLIAAFSPELARGRGMGRVSGWGWGLGYLGGLFTLGLCLAWIAWAESRGQGATEYVPVAMLITAVVFALASLPTLLLLPERAVPRPTLRPGGALDAWREVARTLRAAARFPDLSRFLLASVFYQAGVNVVIALAAIYATQAMGFTTQQTLLLILAVNVAAAAGAFLFGHLQDRLGPVRAIAFVLVGWLLTIALAAGAQTPAPFWAAAHLAGLCLGASQSGGRALVGLLSPPSRRAEFFGFWGLAMKLSAILGPPSYGLVTWSTGGDHRRALWATGLFFLVGLALLTGVRAERVFAKESP